MSSSADRTAGNGEGLDPAMAEALREAEALAVRAGIDPRGAYDLDADRAAEARNAAFWAEGAPAVEDVLPLSLPGADGLLAARLYKPNVPAPAPIVLFVHGGGWAKGSIDTCEWACRQIAARSGLNVIATSYRLAPEHPYPAGLNDIDAVLNWCMGPSARAGLDHRRVLIAGASAGAQLALAACLARRDRGADMPLGLALFYGVFGTDLETESYRAFGDGRYGLPRAQMQRFFDLYGAGDASDLLAADLSGLPPVWLSAAGKDVLRDDALAMHAALRAAAVDVHLRLDEGLAHGYSAKARLVPLAKAAIDDAASFLQAESRRASRLAAYAL